VASERLCSSRELLREEGSAQCPPLTPLCRPQDEQAHAPGCGALVVQMSDPIPLPRLHTEAQASKELNVSIDTLRRERKRHHIGYTRVGNRIRYTDQHLCDYVHANEVRPCQDIARAPDSSPASGLVNGPAAPCFTGHGLTREPDRRGEHRLALMILQSPSATRGIHRPQCPDRPCRPAQHHRRENLHPLQRTARQTSSRSCVAAD
jgi:hypothetical protein